MASAQVQAAIRASPFQEQPLPVGTDGAELAVAPCIWVSSKHPYATKVVGSTAYNLYCVTQNDQLVDVLDGPEKRSATKACQWTWANPDVIARLLNFNDPSPKAWKRWW